MCLVSLWTFLAYPSKFTLLLLLLTYCTFNLYENKFIDLLKSAAALAGRVRSPPLLYNYGPRKQNSPVAASSASLLKDLSCEGTVSKEARANHPNGAEDDESGKSLAQAKFPSASSAYQFQLLIYSIPGGCFNFSRR